MTMALRMNCLMLIKLVVVVIAVTTIVNKRIMKMRMKPTTALVRLTAIMMTAIVDLQHSKFQIAF